MGTKESDWDKLWQKKRDELKKATRPEDLPGKAPDLNEWYEDRIVKRMAAALAASEMAEELIRGGGTDSKARLVVLCEYLKQLLMAAGTGANCAAKAAAGSVTTMKAVSKPPLCVPPGP
jgi:hypothetical protein